MNEIDEKDVIRRVRAGSPLSAIEREVIADILDDFWFRTARQRPEDRKKRKRVFEAFLLMIQIELTEKRLKRSCSEKPRGGWGDAAHAEVAKLLRISPGGLHKRLNRARTAAEELGSRLNSDLLVGLKD